MSGVNGHGVRLLTNVWVPGHPRTKGSLDVVNAKRGVLADSKLSRDWRKLVAYSVRQDRAARGLHDPSCVAVGLRLVFVLPPPAGWVAMWREQGATAVEVAGVEPIHDGVGDLDKLVRNVMDALQDARAYANDVQVAGVAASKIYALADERPGVAIRAWERTADQARAGRAMIYAELASFGLSIR